MLLSLRYGLPTLPFVARPTRGAEAEPRRRPGAARPDLRELDTETGGQRAPARPGSELRPPALQRGDDDERSARPATARPSASAAIRAAQVRCTGSRSFGYDEEGGSALEQLGLLGPACLQGLETAGGSRRRTPTSHASSRSSSDFEDVLDVSVRFTARLAAREALGKERNSLPFMPASAVRPGMVMVDEDGAFDLVERVERVELDAPVYDLDVERTHNFVARRARHAQLDLRVPRRRHPQHPRVRARLRRDEDDRARAELPLDEHDPRVGERGHLAQPRAQAEEPLVRARRGRARARARGRGRARRGALRRGRDRRARRGGLQRQRDRGLLPDERAVAGARGRARPAGDRLPGDRRPALLRAGRDQGRDRLPPGDRQPVRRGLAAADREPAAPRDRRREPRAPPGARGRVRDLALGGVRPGRGGRDRGRAAARGPAVPHAAAVAAVRRARAGGLRADRAGARAERLHRRARGRADDRGAGPAREPAGARRRRARVPARLGASRRCRASSRRSRSTPTRTRCAASRASSR